MLKIITMDIKIFNHIFDMFNGGEGIHIELERDGEPGKPMRINKMPNQGGDDANIEDDDENVSNQFMRAPYDVMSFF